MNKLTQEFKSRTIERSQKSLAQPCGGIKLAMVQKRPRQGLTHYAFQSLHLCLPLHQRYRFSSTSLWQPQCPILTLPNQHFRGQPKQKWVAIRSICHFLIIIFFYLIKKLSCHCSIRYISKKINKETNIAHFFF